MDRPFSDLSRRKGLGPLMVQRTNYENEFGGVRDIRNSFEGVVNNIFTIVSVRPLRFSAIKCALYERIDYSGYRLNDPPRSVVSAGEKGMGSVRIYRLRTT